jgi:hypothetical protein
VADYVGPKKRLRRAASISTTLHHVQRTCAIRNGISLHPLIRPPSGPMSREIRLINKEDVLVYLIDLRSLLSAGTPEQRKSFLASFLKRVSRNREEVEIEYELPLPSERAPLSGDGVLPTDRYGGLCGIRTDDLRVKRRHAGHLAHLYPSGFTIRSRREAT